MVSAQGAVAQVRDRLPGGYPVLETKLQPPSWRRGLIRRPRLIKQLNESAGVPLVALVAPPGCGKSTLLAEWTTTARRLAAWIHVDERDNDPAVLLGYIAVALDRAVGLAPGVFPALASGGSSIWATAMPSLGSAVAHAADDFVLIFDELENLTNPDGRDALMGLAQHLRPGSQIALATRRAAGLPIPRLVAGGQAVVIEREALALDDQEAGDLLSSAGRGRDASEVHTLNVAAEGWAAGLYLSALTLRPGKAASGSTHPPAIGRQLVEDYLRSELLEQLSDEDARFLIRTAPLDRLNASLCDRVLGDAGSASTLERIERSTMFLTPLGMDRRWFRLHSLLREFLLGEVRRQEPDQMVERERRAAAWFEAGTLRSPGAAAGGRGRGGCHRPRVCRS